MFFYRIPAPNQALVISGSKADAGGQFRIVTGKGTFVWPWRQKARILSLDLRESTINEPCVTSQGISLAVEAVAVFKVGDDSQLIANAARRFLDQQTGMERLVGQVLAGHLRSAVGGLTVEDIITTRARLAQEVKDACTDEMEKLGLVVDAFQIQEIRDSSDYIKNLAAPHAAAVASKARIAQANADQNATEAEQEANAKMAQFRKDSEIKQAEARAGVQQAQAVADQSGPLAQAKATQEVVEAETTLAEREAEKREKQLEGEVRRPADAEAYRVKTLAEANADATKLQAGALVEGNLERIVTNKLLDQLPELVRAAAGGLAGANLTVVNGTEGVTQVATGLLTQAFAIVDTVKQGLLTQAAVTTPALGGDGGAGSQSDKEVV